MGSLQCWGRIPNGTQVPLQGAGYTDIDLGGRLDVPSRGRRICGYFFGEDSYNVLSPVSGAYTKVSVDQTLRVCSQRKWASICWVSAPRANHMKVGRYPTRRAGISIGVRWQLSLLRCPQRWRYGMPGLAPPIRHRVTLTLTGVTTLTRLILSPGPMNPSFV